MRRALLMVVGTLAVGGCAGDGARDGAGAGSAVDTRAPEPEAHEQLDQLLAERAKALASGDRRSYVATATGEQRGRDRATMRNRRRVALADVGYEIRRVRLDGRRATLGVRITYSVRGIRGEYSADRRVVATRRGERWRVRREGARRERLPWEVGAYATTRTRHFVVMAPADAELGVLPEVLETAYAAISQRLVRPRPRRRYLVVAVADPEMAHRLTRFIRGTDTLSALTDAKVRDAGPARQVRDVVGLRMLVVLSNFAPLPYEDQVTVLAHELTHAVLTPRTSGRTPAWLTEGIALYLSADRRVGQAAGLVAGARGRGQRRALTLTGLSRPEAIAKTGGDAQAAAYAYASAAAHYIVDRFGERRLLRLYESFNDPAIPGAGGAATTDAAVRRVLRRPLARLEEDLRAWIVTRAIVAPLDP
jgi:hypothetical protein